MSLGPAPFAAGTFCTLPLAYDANTRGSMRIRRVEEQELPPTTLPNPRHAAAGTPPTTSPIYAMQPVLRPSTAILVLHDSNRWVAGTPWPARVHFLCRECCRFMRILADVNVGAIGSQVTPDIDVCTNPHR